MAEAKSEEVTANHINRLTPLAGRNTGNELRNDMTIINFTKERLKKDPVIYTVKVIHNEEGMSFEVYDIQESPKDYDLVADNLRLIADQLNKDAEDWREGLKLTTPEG